MKCQAFLHHFVSVSGWLEGSWGGWVGGGVGVSGLGGLVGGVFIRDSGGVGGVFMGVGWCVGY